MKILKKYANGGKTIQSKSDIRMGGSTHSVSKERRGKKKTFSRNTSMSTPKHLGGTGRTEKFYKTVEREGKEPKRKEISERKYLRKSKRYNKKLGRSKNITHSPSMEESAKAFPSRLPITRTGTFENGGTTGRVPGGQKDERQRDRLRRRIAQKRRKVREGKKYPTGVKESTPAEMRERTKNSQPLPNEFKRRVDWREKKPRYKG